MRYIVLYRNNAMRATVLADVFFSLTEEEAREHARFLPERIARSYQQAIPRNEVLHLLKEEGEGSDRFSEINL